MHIFFDLDGTLTDSSDGIVGCLSHALRVIRCIAAGWGYGSAEKLSAAGGDVLAATLTDVLTHVEAVDTSWAAHGPRSIAR